MTRAASLRPVDRLLILYNVAFGILWLAGLGRVPYAFWLMLAHAGAIWLAWAEGRLGPDASAFSRGLREIYPMMLVALYWLELGLITSGFHSGTHDALVTAWDLKLFGRHLHMAWLPAMHSMGFSELMFAAYWFYYPLVFGAPLVLVLVRHPDVEPWVFRMTVAYTVCFAFYAIFPVNGPSHTMPKYVGPYMDGFFYRLAEAGTHGAGGAGDSLGTAFPSSHVFGAVTAALVAVKYLKPWWAALFVIGALGVALSTVYTQNHFAIDSAVGIIGAIVFFYLVSPWLERVLGGRREAER